MYPKKIEMSAYLQKLRRQSKQLIPQSGGKQEETLTSEPAKTQETPKVQEPASTTTTAGPSEHLQSAPTPAVPKPNDEVGSEPVLDEEDQIFLERLAAIASEPEGDAPPLPTRPTEVLDNKGEKKIGRNAQEALMDGADKVALPMSPTEDTTESKVKGKEKATVDPPHDSLENLIKNLTIKPNGNDSMVSSVLHEGYPFGVSTTTRRLSLLSQAVTLAHGADYASRLTRYLAGVTDAHASQKSEVPDDLSQGDLYLCEQSLSALEGALGACIQAVDEVCGPYNVEKGARRFVSVRPPGHHCESETPMGFCWLNNVAVAAAHGELSCPAFSYCF